MAQLAQALRLNPENREACGLIAATLTQLSWQVPLTGSMRHDGEVRSAQFSADGQRVVTASDDGTARLWDATTGKPIGEPMKHEKSVVSAQFSPGGQRVVTASRDNTARLWDAASGKPIGEPMKHEKSVSSAQFSPDGKLVVTASWDKTARVWDAASRKRVGEPMEHEGVVSSAQFSPDGQRVVTASDDGTARLWDAASGKPIGEPMKHEESVKSAQFSPDGQRVVTAAWDKTARVWDAASGKPVGEPMEHEGIVSSAQFSPDGQRVVTASDDGTARLWDVVIVTDKDRTEDILLLAELAEATGGVALETVGQAENLKLLTPEQVRGSRDKIATKFLEPSSKMTPLQRFMKWSVSSRRSRTISPFSQVTVSEWLENRIKEGTVDGLRTAMQVDPANARVTTHLGRHLADHALKEGIDPDEARRARGEADFLTSRALKLTPDSDEVKKLRDEVAKLLGGIVYDDFALGVDSDGPGGSVAQDPNWQFSTSLKNSDGGAIDSRKIPFIGLPGGVFAAGRVKLGDYAIVFNTFNGRQSFAVVGEVMPNRKQIYVSVALANLLSIQFDLEKQTVRGDKIIYLVFPASGSGHCPESPAAIDEQGQKLFEAWGGISNMRVYLKSSEQ